MVRIFRTEDAAGDSCDTELAERFEAPTDGVPVAGLAAQLRAVVAGLDPAVLSCDDADAALTEVIAIGQLAHAATVLLAPRAVESKRWKTNGERTAGHHLARRMGTSVYAANRLLGVARDLRELPEVEAELRAGTISARKTQLVVDAAKLVPHRQAELIAAARRESVVGLRALHDTIVAANDPRPDRKRHQDAHDNRRLHTNSRPDSTFTLEWANTCTAGVELVGLLQPFIDAEFTKARQRRDRARAAGIELDPEHPDALAADALLAMARAAHTNTFGAGGKAGSGTGSGSGSGPTGGPDNGPDGPEAGSDGHGVTVRPPKAGANAKVIVRIDHQALLRGHVEDGEVCEINGLGPIPVSAVRELMDDAFIAAILTDGIDIRSVVHLGRKPTALQRTALEWRDPVCAVEGCNASRHLEIDHTDDWAETRHTTIDELARICDHDHDHKSVEGYTLTRDPATNTVTKTPPEHGSGSRTDADPGADRRAKARRKRNRSRNRH